MKNTRIDGLDISPNKSNPTNSPEPSPIGEEVEPNYYACQLDKVRVGLTEYSPTIKVFANGNGEDTKHMSLNDESAKTLIQWLKNSFPNCED